MKIPLSCVVALASDGPMSAFDLECQVREQMLKYLYHEQKEYLPAERIIYKDASLKEKSD